MKSSGELPSGRGGTDNALAYIFNEETFLNPHTNSYSLHRVEAYNVESKVFDGGLQHCLVNKNTKNWLLQRRSPRRTQWLLLYTFWLTVSERVELLRVNFQLVRSEPSFLAGSRNSLPCLQGQACATIHPSAEKLISFHGVEVYCGQGK